MKPFSCWTKTFSKANEHALHDYHLTAVPAMAGFLRCYETPAQAIDVVMNSQFSQIIERNEKVIESLLKIIILCGKQGLTLHGYRDDKIDWQVYESGNQGNFAKLVRFRAETDPVLAEYLKEAPKNAQYTSKTIQNELVSVIGDKIRSSIVSEVKEAKCYSIIANEVTDVSNKEE